MCLFGIINVIHTDILFIVPEVGGIHDFQKQFESRIASIQLGTQSGKLTNGQRFRYVVKTADWMTRIRGMRFSSYEKVGRVHLNSAELSGLATMLGID